MVQLKAPDRVPDKQPPISKSDVHAVRALVRETLDNADVVYESDEPRKRIEGFYENQYIDFRDENGQPEKCWNINPKGGEIISAIGIDGKNPVVVETDRGVIVEKDREIATERMWGCTTVFIIGPDVKALIHLTPSSKFPYRDFELPSGKMLPYTADSVQKIITALISHGKPLDQYKLFILGNTGNPAGKYSHVNQDTAWVHLQDEFVKAGVQQPKIVELPLDETLIYHSPERQEELFVMGNVMSYDQYGEQMRDKERSGFWIPLDSDKPIDFGVQMRPPVDQTEH